MNQEAAETTGLRQEILERLRLLHNILTAASYLIVALLIAGFFLYALVGTTLTVWYLLLWPLVFAPLTFNYQANQMTMEAVSAYLKSKEAGHGWETFYGAYKQRVQLTSFLKVLPLLVPQLVPIVLWGAGTTFTAGQQILALVDGVLFLLVVVNFRYKIL